MQIFIKHIDEKLYLFDIDKNSPFKELVFRLQKKSKLKYNKVLYSNNGKIIYNHDKSLKELGIKNDDEIKTKIKICGHGFIYLLKEANCDLDINIKKNKNKILKIYLDVDKENKIKTTIFDCINKLFTNEKIKFHMYNKSYFYNNKLLDLHTPLHEYEYISSSNIMSKSIITFI